ncbi:MAG: elongation factor Ts [Planctomycetota bacterium]|nr:elongation factor Ts [Planctomycetota bacterium]
MKPEIKPEEVKRLRDMTGCGMMDCKRALQDAKGNFEEAIELLRKRGIAKAEKKAVRPTEHGAIASYIHPGSRIGVLLELKCETDFVASNEVFLRLAKDLCMQVAAMKPLAVDRASIPAETIERERRIMMESEDIKSKPENVRAKIVEGRLVKFFQMAALLEQPFIKNDKVTVEDHIKETAGKLGENIRGSRFVRYELGEVM